MHEAYETEHLGEPDRDEGEVVVGADGTPRSRFALLWAADEASLREVPLRVVHAGNDEHVKRAAHPGHAPRGGSRSAPDVAVVDEAVGTARDRRPSLAVRGEVVPGPAPAALIGAAETAGLLVVGARRRGPLARHRPGSVAGHCVRRATCPVMVVHGPTDGGAVSWTGSLPPTRRIVVGIDGSAASDLALRWALEEGDLRHLPVSAVHAWQPPPVGEFIVPPSEASEQLAGAVVDHARAIAAGSDRRRDFEATVTSGAPVPVLVDESSDDGLLVVGARGHGWFHDGVIGSIASRCVDEATCPVAVVRPRRSSVVRPGPHRHDSARAPGREHQVLRSSDGDT